MFADAIFNLMKLTGLATGEFWDAMVMTAPHPRCMCSGGSKRTL